MSKEFYCKNKCGTLVKWPEPYEKGKPPVDAKTGEPHECPNWPKKDEKKNGKAEPSSGSAKPLESFQKSGLEGKKIYIACDGEKSYENCTFEGMYKFADYSPIFVQVKTKQGKTMLVNINKIVRVVQLD